ncbi:non-hydrolyzing UDP-N-acetylglucosamine 2-epimerase [Legionella sp. CNM-1927-20]|uniref:non-hydrolyzing UDP-N-acetylglucosamine 2-epimerase n=1 Tax=Legionella sp. CNM-1927-20 TaxID=3422221 RepID=UPI00403AFFBF
MVEFTKKFINDKELSNEICVVVGTRPGIIMLAPVIHTLIKTNIPYFVIHTGQHYSPAMDSDLFEDLKLPVPEYHLKNTSLKSTHGGQTATMLEGCEEILLKRKPKLVLVNGDANTNLAAGLAARKLRIAVGHIEAGERSFDWLMPEEHNRRILDHISDLLFTTGEKGAKQLAKECVIGKVYITGNTIVDASLNHALLAEKEDCFTKYKIMPKEYLLLTSHREENVDVYSKLKNIIEGAALAATQCNMPILFVAHPRTIKRLKEFDLHTMLLEQNDIIFCEALRYLEFLQLLINAKIVLTDSGGVQQEAYIHKRPCVTLRENTEWSETLLNGCNRLAGANDPKEIADCVHAALTMQCNNWAPIFGDGFAAERIVSHCQDFISK